MSHTLAKSSIKFFFLLITFRTNISLGQSPLSQAKQTCPDCIIGANNLELRIHSFRKHTPTCEQERSMR